MTHAFAATIAAALLGGLTVLSAHHSASARFVPDRQITIEGDLVEIVYRNPHSYLHVAPPDGGRSHVWAVEWGGLDRGVRPGVPTRVLKIGDRVTVTGSPGRDPGAFLLRLQTIVRPSDGWRWSSPGQ